MGQGTDGGEGGLLLVRGAGVKNLDATSTLAKVEACPKPMLHDIASSNIMVVCCMYVSYLLL